MQPRNLCSGIAQKHGDGKADAAERFLPYDVKFPGEQPDEDNDTGLLEWLQNAGIEPARGQSLKAKYYWET